MIRVLGWATLPVSGVPQVRITGDEIFECTGVHVPESHRFLNLVIVQGPLRLSVIVPSDLFVSWREEITGEGKEALIRFAMEKYQTEGRR